MSDTLYIARIDGLHTARSYEAKWHSAVRCHSKQTLFCYVRLDY